MMEVRSFLGFVSYYRSFIPNFPKVAKPLNTLLQNLDGKSNQKKKFKVNQGPEQQEAFETLQRLCPVAPLLAYADFKYPFILHTDARSDGLGVMLYQNQDNQRRVIAYTSGILSPSERNYPAPQTRISCECRFLILFGINCRVELSSKSQETE